MLVSLEEFPAVSPACDAFFLPLPFLKDAPLTLFSAQKFVFPWFGFFFFLYCTPVYEGNNVYPVPHDHQNCWKISILSERAAEFQQGRFINAFMKVNNHPEDRYLNESSALTARKDSAQLYWWKTQKEAF